jgi:hypothetical protein
MRWGQHYLTIPANYDPVIDQAHLKHYPPTRGDIIRSLAHYSQSPPALDILAHELIHDAQHPENALVGA